jgi:hypothetical protein
VIRSNQQKGLSGVEPPKFFLKMPATGDNTRLASASFGKSRLNRDFANPRTLYDIAERHVMTFLIYLIHMRRIEEEPIWER